MDMISIYKCFCDVTRLRILNLLNEGPLCVCHLQEILEESQVKMSKHLGYMKRHGLLESTRKNNWTIHSLPARPHRILKENLKCLQDCQREVPAFRKDLQRRKALMKRLAQGTEDCPAVVVAAAQPTTSSCC